MTCLGYLLLPDKLHFWTDGATYGADGVLAGVSGKCVAAPNLPALFMSRGACLADSLLAYNFAMRFSSFDELVDGVEDALPEVLGAYARLLRVQADIQLLFGGWSASRKRPEAYFIALGDDHLAEGDSYGSVVAPAVGKKEKLRGGGGIPCLTPEDVALGWISYPKTADEVGDIAEYARTTLELHRRKKFPNPCNNDETDRDGEEIHIVGGLGELTTLTKDKIEQQIICRWPDEIGEPITPKPVDWAAWRARQQRGTAPALSLVSSAPPGMNRHQRRQWERENRRRV